MMMKELVPEFKSNNSIYEELDGVVLDIVDDSISLKDKSATVIKDTSN
jgi:hypothetical protein